MRVQFSPRAPMNSQLSHRKIQSYENLANFLFEVSVLKRLQRTGWQILGENQESVAEHSFMVVVISYILGSVLGADFEKTILMALFHDLSETRTGDIYKLADFYVQSNTFSAFFDAFKNLSNADKLIKIVKEYEEGKTLESRIVHDADVLALCLELKQLIEKGNTNAKEWFFGNKKRLMLPVSRKLWEEIKETNSQNWWRKEREKIHQNFIKK